MGLEGDRGGRDHGDSKAAGSQGRDRGAVSPGGLGPRSTQTREPGHGPNTVGASVCVSVEETPPAGTTGLSHERCVTSLAPCLHTRRAPNTGAPASWTAPPYLLIHPRVPFHCPLRHPHATTMGTAAVMSTHSRGCPGSPLRSWPWRSPGCRAAGVYRQCLCPSLIRGSPDK